METICLAVVQDILVKKNIEEAVSSVGLPLLLVEAEPLTEETSRRLASGATFLALYDMQARIFDPYRLAEAISAAATGKIINVAVTAGRYPEVIRKGKNAGMSVFILRNELSEFMQTIAAGLAKGN